MVRNGIRVRNKTGEFCVVYKFLLCQCVFITLELLMIQITEETHLNQNTAQVLHVVAYLGGVVIMVGMKHHHPVIGS